MSHWDSRFVNMAEHVSAWSHDPSTKVGAVVVRPDKTIASVGYNGFPRGVVDLYERLNDRETKLAITVHAEANAIVAARESLQGYTIYTWPFPPCSHCAGLIVQSGIVRVVAPVPSEDQLRRWADSFAMSAQIFDEGGVVTCLV